MNGNKTYVKKFKTVGFVFLSNILLLIIGLGLKAIQTDILSPEDYGNFSFFMAITSFIVLFFRFGFFSSIQVLLAENNDPIKEKKLIGIAFILSLIIGLLFSISIWLVGNIIDDIFQTNIGNILNLFAPLCFLFVFKQMVPSITTGSSLVKLNPINELISRGVFLILLLVTSLFLKLHLNEIIFLSITSMIASVIYIWRQFKPSFKNLEVTWSMVLAKNKSYGFQLYLGQTAQQTTFKFDEIFITYFVNPTQLGFYSLAKFIAMPMVMMSQALSNTLYKSFSKAKEIPKKILLYNFIWLTSCIGFLFLFKDVLVHILFGNEFMQTTDYVIPISIALFFQGLYQPYSFLSAKSKGKEIRNTATIESVVNIIGNLILIPAYGVMGAIYASILSKATHFIGLNYYYRRYLKKN